jgi:predicted Ser/Thr protein kinase
MLDQLIIGDKGSCDDFEASVKERVIHPPKKKSIKKTIPFSNVTHDFSAINGEVYWEERTLEYIFEIIANSAEELEEKKQAMTVLMKTQTGKDFTFEDRLVTIVAVIRIDVEEYTAKHRPLPEAMR